MRSTLTKEFSDKKSILRKVDVFGFFWKVVLGVSEEISVICKDFGLEPRLKMMRRGQLSFLSNQIN